MTLVVGLSCTDSIVVAAEQEEATGYTTKRYVKKLKLYAENNWAVAFAGAGDSSVIDNAEQRLAEWLAGRRGFTRKEIIDELDDILADVHTRYIDPYPQSGGIGLVLGVSCDSGLFLIDTEKRVPRVVNSPACVGIGREVAGYLIDRLHDPNDTWGVAAMKVALATEEAKNASIGCGGEIDFMVLQRPPSPTWRELGCGFYYGIEILCQKSLVAEMLQKNIIESRAPVFENYGGYCDQHRPTPNEDDIHPPPPPLDQSQIDEMLERLRISLSKRRKSED